MSRYDLEERLIDFSVLIIEVGNSLTHGRAGCHLSKQIIRSGTSAALNYAEAQSAESRKDFIHKMRVVLKELRETSVCLKIVNKAKIFKKYNVIQTALSECNELISIFFKSIGTAQMNLVNTKREK